MSMFIDDVGLNSAQYEAVTTTEGPLLILAGAGSGKTRVLTYRIAHMVADLGVEPYQILAITFTNKAAAEMRARINEILGSIRGMWILTFHALCVRMIRENAERLGYKPSFTIYDDDDSKRLMKEIFAELDINTKLFNSVRSAISKAKNELIDVDTFEMQAAKFGRDTAVCKAYRRLQERLKIANAMDFDDLLMLGHKLLAENIDVLEEYQERFRYISVDEYQDTNHAQYEIAKLLSSKYRNLMVVGDDDQSIYSWRGADIKNILNFEKDYPDAHVVKLEENYRSTGIILDAANAVITNNTARKSKKLFTSGPKGDLIDMYLSTDERDEGRWIASEIEKYVAKGYSYSDVAVFYRTNAQSRSLEDMFLRAGIPYQIVGGTRFFDRAEIRDVMAYLNVVVNPADDVAAKRIVNTPRRGIGKTTIETISQRAVLEGISFMDALQLSIADESLSTKARNGLAQFDSIIRNARSYSGSLRDIVEMIVDKSGLISSLEAQHTPEADDRIENIREFFGVVSEFEETHMLDDEEENIQAPMSFAERAIAAVQNSRKIGESRLDIEKGVSKSMQDDTHDASDAIAADDFATDRSNDGTVVRFLTPLMEWLALRSDLDTLSDYGAQVTMMTVHSAKGLEFPIVFLAGMEDGIFPHLRTIFEDSGIEEERRLAYVAITRAREHLSIVCAQQRSLFGQTQQNPRSRFVQEIPEECINLAGVGSLDYYGTGYEKRGSRRGIYGSGTRYEQSDGVGRIFGSSGFGPLMSSGKKNDSKEEEKFEVGDIVDHKVFGKGRVIEVAGDEIHVEFEKTGQTKKLLVGFAPIVKVC